MENEQKQIDELLQYVRKIRVINNDEQVYSIQTKDLNSCYLLQQNSPSDFLDDLLKYSIINPSIAECKFFLGFAYELNKQYQNAANQYELCIKLDPFHREAYNSLGQMLIILGQDAVAIQQFKRQIEVNSKHTKSFFNLGNIYMSMNKVKDTSNIFTNCSKNHKKEVIYSNTQHCQICLVKYELFELNESDLAMKRLQLISEDNGCESDAEHKLIMAQIYFQQMDYAKVESIISTISSGSQFQEEITYLQGMSLFKQNKLIEASNCFKLNENHNQSIYQLGIISRDAKKLTQARSFFFRSSQNSPDNLLYLKTFIELELIIKRNVSAIKYLEVYQKLVKDDIFSLFVYSHMFFDQKQCQNAFIYVSQINKLDISQFETLETDQTEFNVFQKELLRFAKKISQYNKQNQSEEILLGYSEFFQTILKNQKQAEHYVKIAYSNNFNSISNLKRLLECYIYWENWKEFDELILNKINFKKILEKSDDVLLLIGNTYFNRDYTHAAKFFEQAFEANKNLREPHLRIAQLEFIKQDFKKSQEFLSKAELPSPQINDNILYELLYLKAQLLIQNDNEMKALPLLKKCIKLRPLNENSYFSISSILHKLKSKQASEYLKKGKELNKTNELGLIIEAQLLFQTSRPSDYSNSLNQCFKLYPISQICCFYLGEFHLKQNEWEKATHYLQECLGMNYNLSSIYSTPLSNRNIIDCKCGLASALIQLNREQEALDLAYATFKQNPSHTQLIKLLTVLLLKKGNINETIRLCQQYLSQKSDDSEVHYILANARILKKDACIAIPSLLHCKKLNPSFPEINLRLGEAYEEDGNHLSAFESYTNQLNYEPTNKKALLKYIWYSSILIRFQQAQQGLNNLLRLYPRDSDAYYAEAQLYFHQGDITNALTLLEESVRLDPLEETKVFFLVHIYQLRGLYEKQIQLYNTLIISNPNNSKILTEIGTSYLLMHKYDKAKEFYMQCVTLDSYSADYHSNLALGYFVNSEYYLALKSFQHSISLKPDHINSLYNIALTLKSMGNEQQAIIAFQKCIKMHPYFIKAYISLAKLQITQNMLQNAQQTCMESLERHILNIVLKQEDDNGDVASIHYLISVIHGKKKDYQSQIDKLLQCLKYFPQNMKYLNSLALAYANQEDNQNAYTILILSTNLYPHNTASLFNLAEIQHRISQFPQQIETLRKCIHIDHLFEKAYINLGIAQTSINDITGAISTYLQCIGLFPNNSDAHFNLGNLYSSQNKHSSNSLAIISYSKALSINPHHLPSLHNIGLIYLKTKQYSQAINCFEKCILISPSSKQEYNKIKQIISTILNY